MFGNVGNPGYVTPGTDDGAGAISFVGTGRASLEHNAMFNGGTAAPTPPATTNGFNDAGPAARYTGPNFAFVPEPAAAGFVALGLLSFATSRRRKAAWNA